MPEKVNSRPASATHPGTTAPSTANGGSTGRRHGGTGKPIRFEDVRREGWYFKDLPQNVAEAILKRQSPGHFLVTQLGAVSIKLFLVTMRTIKNFDIETLDSDGKSYYRIGKGLLFASIQQLVDHYKKSPGLGIMLDKFPERKLIDDLFALQLNEVKIVQPFDLRLPWDVRFGHWRKSDVIIQQCRDSGHNHSHNHSNHGHQHAGGGGAMDDQKALFSRHSKILMAIKHENIAALLGCGLECSRCFLVTESLSEGSLIEYLHRNTMSLLLRPNDLLKISRDICKAMEYLEERRIVHNELAAENCVIDEVCRVKLTGFHLSRYEGDYESLMIPEYIYKVKSPPPEFYQNQFSCRSDVWSFGFLLWTVFKRGQDESFDIDRILNADWGTRLPVTIISRARHLIASCLVEQPNMRPKFKEILPFLHEENFPGPPYRFREYSSEEATASSGQDGEGSQEDEPKAKIIKVPPTSAGKTKFPSMSNLADAGVTSSVQENKPPPPPRNPGSRGETPTNAQIVKPQRRSQSAMQAPIPKLDVSVTTEITNDGTYSRLRPHVAFREQPKTADASPHRSSAANDFKDSSLTSTITKPASTNQINNLQTQSVQIRAPSIQKLQPGKQEMAPHMVAASNYSVPVSSCPHKMVPYQTKDENEPRPVTPKQPNLNQSNLNNQSQNNQSSVSTNNNNTQRHVRSPRNKPPPSPVRQQTLSPTASTTGSQSQVEESTKSTTSASKKRDPVSEIVHASKSGSSTPVHITPLSHASSTSGSTQSNSQGRFGYDRSTPNPDNRNHASQNQARTITGSAINVRNSPLAHEEEPSTFMEYDVSNASGYARIGTELRNVRQDAVQDEDIIALREMLDYATERIEFSEQTRQDATREKNLVVGEISKTELKCMTEVEELSRMFFKHIQDMQTQLMDQNTQPITARSNSANQNPPIDDDVKAKRLNEMKLRGRIAMRQLKQELKQAWNQNRDLMTKIVLLSHSSNAAVPLQDRSLRVDNSVEVANQNDNSEQNTENQASSGEYYNTSAILNSPVRPKTPISNSAQKSPNDLPESEAPVHVLEFLRKFIAAKDISVLEKEQVKVLFKALDQAYNDQQKLQQTIQNMSEQNHDSAPTTGDEQNSKSSEQIQEYKNKVSKLRNKLATIMDENSQLRAKVEQLKQTLEKANHVVAATREKVVERDLFEQKCQTLEQKLKRVESQMTENDKNFKRTLVNLKQELKEALDGKKHFEREINNLLIQQQQNVNGSDQKAMMTKLQQLERERLEAEARAEALAENLKFLTTRMESQEMQIYHGKATIDGLRKDIETLQKQNQTENSPQYRNLATQVQSLEKKLQTAESKMSEIICERDQFKFLYELSLQKLRAQDEKPKHLKKAEKKLLKQAENAASTNENIAPKKTSALNLLEKKFLSRGSSKSNSTQSISATPGQTQIVQPTPFNNPAYAASSLGFDSERTSLNSSVTVTSSSGGGANVSNPQNTTNPQIHHAQMMQQQNANISTNSKLNQRPKLISPRIAKSPVPMPASANQNQSSPTAEIITPISTGKLKGKWQAL